MSVDIHSLEGRNGGKDWPVIVMSIACPKCGVMPGAPCIATERSNPFMTGAVPRLDWHAERKYAAAEAWYASGASEAPKEIAPLIVDQRAPFSTNEQQQIVTAPAEQQVVPAPVSSEQNNSEGLDQPKTGTDVSAVEPSPAETLGDA